MARTQSTRRMTRKGSKQLTDDKRASQVASRVPPQEEDQKILKDPATLTEAGRKSQEFFKIQERIKDIRDAQARGAKMTEEEIAEDLEKTRLSMGMIPKYIILEMRKRDKQRGKPKGPYISLDDKAAALVLQTAVPDPIEIGDDNNNDNNGQSQDHQECANNTDDDLFSADSDDDNDNNYPNDDNDPMTNNLSQPKKKKRSKRKPPTSAIRNPRNAHWAGMRTPEEGEATDVLVAIVAEHNVARFMVMDGLDCVTEIQELSKGTIALYARIVKGICIGLTL